MNKADLEAAPYAALGLFKGVWEQEPAVAMWGATLGLPLSYDVWAAATGHETMSHAFHRAWEHPNPFYKYMCIGLVGALAVHLCHGTKAQAP